MKFTIKSDYIFTRKMFSMTIYKMNETEIIKIITKKYKI